jgi:2-aminobenzoate-CoA ligase
MAFQAATGLSIVNVLGSTEMLHAFLSTGPYEPRPGSVGKPVRGYKARVLAPDGREAPVGEVGRLAVVGPTGCRYLNDSRQSQQVVEGWNLTGDLARMDDDGYFWLEGGVDQIVVSSGYNISLAEVEEVLLGYPGVAECVVVPEPDALRGCTLRAIVVPNSGLRPDADGAADLLDYMKQEMAGYKCPRRVEFRESLPHTATGKVARAEAGVATRE